MDPGAIAEWRALRDFERAGLPPGRLPELVGELTRKQIILDERIKGANAMPADIKAAPGTIKAAIIYTLLLERELLDLPGAILAAASPETLPEKVYELVLAALRASRGEDPATSPPPAGTRRGAASPATGPRRGRSTKNRKGLYK
ncbi:MAG: hypothetical protein ACYDAX_10205 [Desulfobacteria bacterium]